MEEQYSRSYATLGLPPGSAWADIRSAYKALIREWHPDHFQQHGGNRSNAEERTMEITRAYKTLADYYRIHGSTPLYPSSAPSNTSTMQPPAGHTAPAETASTAPASNIGRDSDSILTEGNRWKIALILFLLVLLAYFWFQHDPIEPEIDSQASALDTTQAVAGEPAKLHPADKFFTRGSRLGEVYAIQGIPSKTEAGIWHYGNSRVYFSNGVVSRWDEHPDNPLRASLEIDPVSTARVFIQRGSTKAEVRALQGSPWSQTEREWTYGSSRIFFNDEVVVDWKDSPLHPLKIQR